jgi:Holliday junction resolvase RusA-like endonuclease
MEVLTVSPVQLELTINGDPIAKARPRFRISKSKTGKPYPRAYQNQESEEGKFLAQILDRMPNCFSPTTAPLRITMRFYIKIPVSFSKKKRALAECGLIYPTGRPDLDNYAKFILDLLNEILWQDDAQVVEMVAMKAYSSQPRTVISASEIITGGTA